MLGGATLLAVDLTLVLALLASTRTLRKVTKVYGAQYS